MRAWARTNGYDVADRGRLPAELTDAYLAAQDKGGATGGATGGAAAKRGTAPAAKQKAAARTAPARKAATKTAATATATAASPSPGRTAAPGKAPAPATSAAPAAKPEPRPKPSPVSDDRRLVALGEQLAALTDRVNALEKALGDKGGSKATGKRFRRSR